MVEESVSIYLKCHFFNLEAESFSDLQLLLTCIDCKFTIAIVNVLYITSVGTLHDVFLAYPRVICRRWNQKHSLNQT